MNTLYWPAFEHRQNSVNRTGNSTDFVSQFHDSLSIYKLRFFFVFFLVHSFRLAQRYRYVYVKCEMWNADCVAKWKLNVAHNVNEQSCVIGVSTFVQLNEAKWRKKIKLRISKYFRLLTKHQFAFEPFVADYCVCLMPMPATLGFVNLLKIGEVIAETREFKILIQHMKWLKCMTRSVYAIRAAFCTTIYLHLHCHTSKWPLAFFKRIFCTNSVYLLDVCTRVRANNGIRQSTNRTSIEYHKNEQHVRTVPNDVHIQKER